MRPALFVMTLLSTGCSLALQGPPAASSRRPDSLPVECTSESIAPTVDRVAGVAFGLGALLLGMVAASMDHFDCDNDCDTPAISGGEKVGIAGGVLLFSVPWFLAAQVGDSTMEDCQAAQARVGTR